MADIRSAPPKVTDFSKQAVKGEVLKQSLTHWLTMYPPAFGLPLGLAAFLFNMPLLYLGMVGSLTIGFASAIVNIFFREEVIAGRYLENLTRKLQEEEKRTLQNLAGDLQESRHIEVGGAYAEQGLEQFKRLQHKYENVSALLSKKLNRGELAFGRFIGAAEQVYLSGLDNLKQVAAILQSLGSIDPQYIQARLRQLEAIPNRNDMNQKEKETLLKRLTLRDSQLEKVNALLTHNEEAMTTLEETTAAIATMDTDGKFAGTDFESAIGQLQEIAERASIYNKS